MTKRWFHMPALLLAAHILLAAGNAEAATYNLRAGVTTKTMPDGAIITMWGFADDKDGPGTGTITVPGPVLTVPHDDAALTVNLKNDLTQEKTGRPGGVPLSIVIPAAEIDPSPAKFVDGQGRARARSLTKEVQPGTTGTYSWNLPAGTFLYHSGSHPAVQVQMGLYGAAKKDQAPQTAYSGISYQNEAILLYSEIDPGLHQAVAANTYGTGAYTSTINYDPRYFLVNGEPFSGNPIAPGAQLLLQHPLIPGEILLVRMLNAGLKNHSPAFQNLRVSVVAEDGNAYSYPKDQYSVLLPALKTMDVTLPTPSTSNPIYDRALHLTNGPANLPGGLVVYLAGGAPGGPVAVDDAYAVNEDGFLQIAVPGVLQNDHKAPTALLACVIEQPTVHGTLIAQTDGSFSYQPNENFTGSDSFTYHAVDGTTPSNTATAVIKVNPVNDPPVAAADSYTVLQTQTLTIPAPGVLGNDTDIDSAVVTAQLVTPPAIGALTLNTDGSFTYQPPSTFFGEVQFSYQAKDSSQALSSTVQVTITIEQLVNTAPVAAIDTYQMNQGGTLTVPAPGVLSNDTDTDGPAALTASATNSPANSLSFTFNPNGSFSYTPITTFTGSVSFSYTAFDGAATSSSAQVTITVNPTTNVPPVAVNDAASTKRNIPAVINVVANDSDPNGTINPATVVITTNPGKGVATANVNGTVSYTPPRDWLGNTLFRYTVKDDRGATSNIATVNVSVVR